MTEIENSSEYWIKLVSDLEAPLALPLDKERPPVSSFLRETASLSLESEDWSAVKDLAAKQLTPPLAVLLAAFKALAFRYTGELNLLTCTALEGSPSPPLETPTAKAVQCANEPRRSSPSPPLEERAGERRPFPATSTEVHWEERVGERRPFHGNAVPLLLATRLADVMSAADLISQIALSLKEAARHSCPFEQLTEILQQKTGPSLCNTAFLFSAASRAGDLDGIAEEHRPALTSFLAQCDLVFHACEQEQGLGISCEYDAEIFDPPTIDKFLKHYRNLLLGMVSHPNEPLDALPLLEPAERHQLLVEWNATQTDYPRERCIHHLFEAQAAKTPGAVAVIFEEEQLTYRQLNERAGQVANYLRQRGVGPETLVGLHVQRSLDMMVGLLGILKAGAAYLPLDPAYPRERLAFMLADSQAAVLLTQARLRNTFPGLNAEVVSLDSDWEKITRTIPSVGTGTACPRSHSDTPVQSENLAYVIYTSGSTGKPKGVMISHRNVVNFFAGMDRAFVREQPGTWLAVTSICFDISVLELLWTLTRGFKVVIAAGDDSASSPAQTARVRLTKPLDFSMFFFSADPDANPGERYRLMLEGAKFADENGFTAVWTPERHFHRFGGLYPNPSVTSAALAMITKRVQIRAGSVVAPLHMPLRVAEEWAVVDNLSQGRVAVSFASGWMPEDFVLQPQAYTQRKNTMFRDIELVRRLWRGEAVQFPGPAGEMVSVKISPRPIQAELPVWVTAAGHPETFERAGALQAGLLTHLLGQSIEEVASKIALYRKAWQEAGHPGRGRVALMLHAFVGESLEFVKHTVRGPLTEYLRASADLIKKYSWAFSPFKTQGKTGPEVNFADLPKADLDAVLEHAFQRYFESSGLFGTPESCLKMLEALQGADVDEVACLVDFGVPEPMVLENLPHLRALRDTANQRPAPEPGKYSVPALIRRYRVTHMQCTPSMARMLLLDGQMKEALGGLEKLVLGGEALPLKLAAQLRDLFPGEIINMYGPTETTVWSTTFQVNGLLASIPIGRPIANTEIFLLDKNLQPVPVGIEGELFIGGAGVARGYLNRPDLTAERFIPNPFNPGPNSRLYRTGDRARYLPDGKILYLGRMDHQVKIRGYRIEPGEIEALLNEHPAVQASVVTAHEEASGDKKLIAYVILRKDAQPSATLRKDAQASATLRNFLKEKLPDYMVPAHLLALDAFPQTPNGKIDRKALPPPDGAQPEIETVSDDSPRTPVEKALAELWAETLGVKKVGRHDNFFELGGHSLAAIQIISNIRQACEVDLALQSIFRAPTVAALAAQLEKVFLGQGKQSDPSTAPSSGLPEQQLASGRPLSRGELEKVLADLWAQTLGLGRVGLEDNFFKLGGNSLLAIQLIARLETLVRKRLSLRTLFDAPTIRQLAAQLGAVEVGRALPSAPPEVGRAVPSTPQLPEPFLESSLILRRKNRDEYPLSAGQKRLWFLHQLEGGCHYNDHFNLRLTGALNLPALERTLAEIVRRHEAMRAAFNGEARQRIVVLHRLAFPCADLRSVAEGIRLEEARRLAVAEARKPFDLENGPLWRFGLLVLDETDHLLLINAHHIAIDGWSRGVFLREFAALYPAFAAGERVSLPELPIQYADYAAWHNNWLETPALLNQFDYWKQTLAGVPTLLDLPADRPRPPVQSFSGARHFLNLSKSLTQDLRALGQAEGATLFMTLLAGFQSLLWRYSGQEQFLIGSPVANRPRPEIENLIGYFLNTVVLRGDLSGQPTFRQLLSRAREISLGSFENQDLPLEKLMELPHLERTQSYSPLFQIFFVLQNAFIPDVALPGLSARPFEIDNGTTKFDLTLSLLETGDGLSGWFEYATDLFEADRIARMAGHLQVVLEAAVRQPDAPLSRLPMLTAPELTQTIHDWNRTAAAHSTSQCVHELFEAQAQQTPKAIAVQFKNQRLTYAQLDESANRLAAYMQSLGVGPEKLVGVCLDRSLDMLIGLLAVLKAGGAYLPLDPTHPAERLAFILNDAEATILLTQKALAATAAQLQASGAKLPQIVYLDEWVKNPLTLPSPHRMGRGLPDAPAARTTTTPNNLAYVIYTSGSTGKPKGVQIEHHSLVNFMASMQQTPGITPEDVLLAVTTLSFDIAGLELFLPLTTGARVVIADKDAARDGHQLAHLLSQSGATAMQATPATWRLLIEAGWEGNPRLKILCGGEAWGRDLAEALLRRCGSLWNMYGPTETTIWSAASQVTAGQPVVIGRPIANTTFYILDSALQPAPVGVPGELCIGGEGVARGYLNRPDLTAEKFVPDPFSAKPGARLYKTGDLARYLPDGQVEYLRRLDHQVKIRGFRIETGEIEAVLNAHPGVRENVVVRQGHEAEARLVAYWVAKAQPAPTPAELREHLAAKLPDYMAPSLFVVLAALPRTPNGKVDRQALPKPEQQRPELAAKTLAPRDKLETQLTHLWEKILGVQPVGIRDNFFEIGGHSFLALRLFAQIEKVTGKRLPLSTLFQAPTIEQLANRLRDETEKPAFSSLVPINPVGKRNPFYCVHGGGGNVLLFRSLAQHLSPDFPLYGLQSRGLDGKGEFLTTIEEMASYYLQEIRQFQRTGPYYLGGFCMGGKVALEIAQQLIRAGETVALLAMFDTYNHGGRAPALSSWQQLIFHKEKFLFHWANLQSISSPQKMAYLREKFEGAKERERLKIAAILSKLLGRSAPGNLPFNLEKLNEQAGFAYQPKPYSGRITLFKFQKNFSFLEEPQFLGWEKVPLAGLEIIEVPVHPGGMFVEPYVGRVAEKLKSCLLKAQP